MSCRGRAGIPLQSCPPPRRGPPVHGQTTPPLHCCTQSPADAHTPGQCFQLSRQAGKFMYQLNEASQVLPPTVLPGLPKVPAHAWWVVVGRVRKVSVVRHLLPIHDGQPRLGMLGVCDLGAQQSSHATPHSGHHLLCSKGFRQQPLQLLGVGSIHCNPKPVCARMP